MRSISQLVRLKTILKSITVGIPVFFFCISKKAKTKKGELLTIAPVDQNKAESKRKGNREKKRKGTGSELMKGGLKNTIISKLDFDVLTGYVALSVIGAMCVASPFCVAMSFFLHSV